MVMIDYDLTADHLVSAQVTPAGLLLPHCRDYLGVVRAMRNTAAACTLIADTLASDLFAAQFRAPQRDCLAGLQAVAAGVLRTLVATRSSPPATLLSLLPP